MRTFTQMAESREIWEFIFPLKLHSVYVFVNLWILRWMPRTRWKELENKRKWTMRNGLLAIKYPPNHLTECRIKMLQTILRLIDLVTAGEELEFKSNILILNETYKGVWIKVINNKQLWKALANRPKVFIFSFLLKINFLRDENILKRENQSAKNKPLKFETHDGEVRLYFSKRKELYK